MTTRIWVDELQRLLADGAQLIEVLPEPEYAEAHLPGAVNVRLKQLDADSTRILDRGRQAVVYCWDSL